MDMRDGYWGVPLRHFDLYLTAFKTFMGLMQFTIMAMGLRNAGPLYQKSDQKNAIVLSDDISVATDEENEQVSA